MKILSLINILNLIFVIDIFALTSIPVNSSINKTLGAWSCDLESSIENVVNVDNIAILYSNVPAKSPAISESYLKNPLPDSNKSLYNSFSYRIYLEEYSMFFGKRVSISSYSSYPSFAKYLEDCYYIYDELDYLGFANNCPLDFYIDPLKQGCRKVVIGANKLFFTAKFDMEFEYYEKTKYSYSRFSDKLDNALLRKYNNLALFYNTIVKYHKKNSKFKTYADIDSAYKYPGIYSSIKEKILSSSGIISKLSGKWDYVQKDNDIKYRFNVINYLNSLAISLTCSVGNKTEIFPNNIRFNNVPIMSKKAGNKSKPLSPILQKKQQLVDEYLYNISNAKYKIPYQYFGYDSDSFCIMLVRGYDYITERNKKYIHISDNSRFKLISNSENEMLFEGVRLYLDSDGFEKRKSVYLKWKIDDNFTKITEFIKYDSNWIEYATWNKIESSLQDAKIDISSNLSNALKEKSKKVDN